jgi:hypothetical protein
MGVENSVQRHPVFAMDSLLGWVVLDESLTGANFVSGGFQPGPGFAEHRELFEEAIQAWQAFRAQADDVEKVEESPLWQRWNEAGERIARLGITVGESRHPVKDVALYDDWRLELYPPGGRFGPPEPDPEAAYERAKELSPVPSHLTDWVGPATLHKDRLTAGVRCPCGGTRFEFHFTGESASPGGEIVPSPVEVGGVWFFLIKAVCNACRREHVLFEEHFHGHDSFLYHNEQKAALPRPPLCPLHCQKCRSAVHEGEVIIISDFKVRYFKEGYAEKFGADRWPDAFGCFAMGITCCNCGHHTPVWVDYETR